ncbi:MAG: sulfurtransferase [Nitrosomonadaceae bacterium]|nr:sulfurtransferase [Nitrosomonadaceae bacterium]|tara:strand:- start:268 stop:615 length:348 start_codon:yes stop_codon:yes gene_type:complete
MIKTAGELVAKAQTMINCLDIPSAMSLCKNPENTIIDVREPEEAAISKLKNSINIPRGLIEMKIPSICPDPDTLILLHCAGGGRASLAALTLQEIGYTNVHAITEKFEEIKEALD